MAVVVEAAMASEGERQVTGPGGTLAERVGDHVASADLLLRQSHEAVERVRARVQESHGRVERTFWRVQEAAGGVRAVQRATTEAMERFLRIKQRELAAHLAAEALHERAAELQERMGHLERAAQARRQAEQARVWYRLAGEELADYQARIAAVMDKAGSGHQGNRLRPTWRERSGSR